MKRTDRSKNKEQNRKKAEIVAFFPPSEMGTVTDFPALGTWLRRRAKSTRVSLTSSLGAVFFRAGAIPLAGDHFCHGRTN